MNQQSVKSSNINFSQALNELQEKIHEHESLQLQRTTVQKNLAQAQKSADEALLTVQALQKQLGRLERNGLTSFFYRLIRKLETTTEQLQRELLKAKAEHAGAVNGASAIQEELGRLESRLSELSNVHQEYKELFDAKREIIVNSETLEGKRLRELEATEAELKAKEKEIDDAILAAESAYRSVKAVLDSLDSAETMGMISVSNKSPVFDVLEHSHLSDAQSRARQLQQDLEKLKKELVEVEGCDGLMSAIDHASALQVADFCFDNIAFDFISLSNTYSAESEADEIKRNIGSVLNKLRGVREKVQEEQRLVCKQIRELIETVNI